MKTKRSSQRDISTADLAPYAGRWVAVVRGRVAGVGWTAEEARQAAKRNRPKEKARVIFVPAVEGGYDDPIDDCPAS